MKEHLWKYIFSAAGVALICTILLFAARWVIAQEVAAEVEPIRAEQRAASKIIADMQFEDRFEEVQLERDLCMDDHTPRYCDAQAEWRWEVYYPYIDCIAGLEYKLREETCGPEPKFIPPEE